MRNGNGLLTWSIPIIIPYDTIFSKNWWSATYCLAFPTGLDWFQSPDWFRLILQMTYRLIIAKKKWYFAFGDQF